MNIGIPRGPAGRAAPSGCRVAAQRTSSRLLMPGQLRPAVELLPGQGPTPKYITVFVAKCR